MTPAEAANAQEMVSIFFQIGSFVFFIWVIALMVGLGRIWHWVALVHREAKLCRETMTQAEQHLAAISTFVAARSAGSVSEPGTSSAHGATTPSQ